MKLAAEALECNLGADVGPIGEQDLIARVRSGDGSAFLELIRSYERPTYLIAYSILNNQDSAEDAARKHFLKAHKNLGQLQPTNSFKSWLLEMILDECSRRNEGVYCGGFCSSGDRG